MIRRLSDYDKQTGLPRFPAAAGSLAMKDGVMELPRPITD